MKSTEFVYALREKLLNRALENYSITYNKQYENEGDDYISAIQFFQSLSDKEQKHIFYLIKVAVSDTLADFLGWLDGQNYFEFQSSNPVLNFEENEKAINGYLQDIWFNLEGGMSKEELNDEFD